MKPIDEDKLYQWWVDTVYGGHSYASPEAISKALVRLHDEYDLSWPKIGSLGFLERVPPSTLYDIADTAKVPKKWRAYLSVKPDYPPRIAISKVNVDSAVKTIVNNLDRNFIYELWDELGTWLDVWRD